MALGLLFPASWLERAQLTFVVTSVPDERKGERLVVLHILPDPSLHPCLERLAKEDLPNLWKPHPCSVPDPSPQRPPSLRGC